jgi:transglutaminase-like putative cysteine protease
MNRRSDTMQIGTEAALFMVTVAAIVGMHRLFQDGSYRGPLIFQAFAAHLTMAVLRRFRFRLLPAALVTVAVGAIVIACSQYLSTTWLVLPSPETFSTISHDMNAAWAVFRQQRAPAPVEPGFVVATSVTVWVIAFVADWGAFRTGVSFEALLPPATLFLFASVLGAEGQRSASAAFFVATAMLFLLLHRTWRQEDSASWAALQQQRGRWSLVSTGLVLGTGAVIVGACVGPSVPGANDDPIFPWRDLGENRQQRVVLSPLVDIRGRLVEQSNLEVFTVQTDDGEGYYWRLTALDDFDGTIWKSTYDTAAADGELPEAVPEGTATTTVTQEFTIAALGQIWLPGAYAPKSVQVDGEDSVKYDEASGTLIVPRSLETSDGLHYTVQSEVVLSGDASFTEQLRNAPTAIPESISKRYTDLPDDFSDKVSTLAAQITAGKQTEFDKAMALQDYLQGFTYDLTVAQGHGKNALERFLLDSENGKKGYCEQFAAAYAAMARSVGLPARVAVGFTEGQKDRFTEGLFRVKGRNAHAWPEVYFPGSGWVLFEPTPGRGPGNADYLDLPEAQDNGDAAPNQSPEPGGPQGPTTTVAGGGPQGPTRPSDPDEGVAINEPDTSNDSPVRFQAPPLRDVAGPAGIGVMAYLLLVPLAFVIQRSVRRARARLPRQKVDLAWWETNESAATSGIVLAPSLTVAERAARLRLALPGVSTAINLVAHSVERATYAEVQPTVEEADEVAAASTEITAAANQRMTWWSRALAYLDVRRLFPRSEQSRRTAHGAARTR